MCTGVMRVCVCVCKGGGFTVHKDLFAARLTTGIVIYVLIILKVIRIKISLLCSVLLCMLYKCM